MSSSEQHKQETVDGDADGEDVDIPGGQTIARIINAIKRPFQVDTGEISPVWDDSDTYDFSHRDRGLMVIVNNEHFKGHSPRPGSGVDVASLQKTFSSLGFNVNTYHNQTQEQMMKIFKKASRSDHSQADCFACAILSHGDQVHVIDKKIPDQHVREDVVYGTDQIILTRDIVGLFTDQKCPTLTNKPRLFFMQACRGSTLDSGVDLSVYNEDSTDGCRDKTEVTPCPLYKDFLIMYATPPGYYAFRRPDTGSWFVRALCEVLDHPEASSRHLRTLLTAVVRLVAQKYQSRSFNLRISGKKQTPCFSSMLTKDIYLTPKS
ncbi:caspase-3-like [Mya arenaria]|uniref:caspase-3-like n=1 Tax=Mya arenaria TaxID=6604 RepID=UPI0022E0314E|nr:caspase-3-like [Mya arenaria]XP_052791313.1 caspase-3-like [Mya arenaria]